MIPPVADDMLYQGFFKNYLHPAGDEDYITRAWSSFSLLSLMFFWDGDL
jgi:hypothetical protein